MQGSAQPEDPFPSAGTENTVAGTDRSSDQPLDQPSAGDAVVDNSNGSRALAETELDAALQLLVERALYITGATGTALALPQGEEMVCRASAGSSAPAVGARLQVSSGLTGESIARRQLLRCDNAEADPRVNLETCRALGIASIVVLPLLRRSGEVRGLFELFSDHPYAFEERDLIALERMAGLTLTALDLAEQRQASSPALSPALSPAPAPAPEPAPEPEKAVESPGASSPPEVSAITLDIPQNIPPNPSPEPESAEPEFAEPEFAKPEFAKPESAEPAVLPAEPAVISPPEPAAAPIDRATPDRTTPDRTTQDRATRDQAKRARAGRVVRLNGRFRGPDARGIRAGLPGKPSASQGIVAGKPRQSVGDLRPDSGRPGRGGGVSITTFVLLSACFP